MKKRSKNVLALMIIVILVLGGAYMGALKIAKYKQDAIIKSQVETAVSMLQAVYDKTIEGEYNIYYAKLLGADILRGLGYGPDGIGYFWADTTEGVNVVLYGNKDVEGKNRYNDKVNGVSYIKNIIDKAITGGGYTSYYYIKQGGKVPLAKRAYSMEFKPFGWVVGTGYYLDDLSPVKDVLGK